MCFQQMTDERNYHIFYCMLAGMTGEEKKQLDVKDATEYYYLIQVSAYRKTKYRKIILLSYMRNMATVLWLCFFPITQNFTSIRC